jgi:hypothetical protein
MRWTCPILLQWCGYFEVCSTQVPDTYSLSQLLPSHVYLSSNGHRKVAQIDVYTPGLEIRLFLCSHRVWKCFYDGDILDSGVHVTHTYSLSQLLSSHVYWSSHSHPRIAQIDVYTLRLEMRLLSCSQLVPNCFNDEGTLEYAPRRYPTHIRCPNYWHHMCMCQAIGTEKALKFTLIHTG